MNKKELTGEWYLSKRTLGGFNVMVQVKIERWKDPSYGNGSGRYAPEKTEYQKATESDLTELGINFI